MSINNNNSSNMSLYSNPYNPSINPMWNSYSPNNPYNNYINRQQMLPMQPIQQQQSRQNNIIWVKGKENARSMQLPPNSTVILLDNEVGKFYIKTTDDIGLGKLRIFSYIEEPDIQQSQQNTTATSNSTSSISELDLSNYVTKDELSEIIKEIKDKNNEQFVSRAKSTSGNNSNVSKQLPSTVNQNF